MRLNITFIIEAVTIRIRKRIIWLLMLVFFISCSSLNNVGASKKELITLNSLVFNDEKLVKLILSSRDNFEKKYSKKPSIIVIEYFLKEGVPTYELTNYSFLYNSYHDKEILNYNFKGGAIIERTTVLLIDNSEKCSISESFDINNSKRKFEILYGKSTDMCLQKFSYSQNKFNLIESICSFDLILE